MKIASPKLHTEQLTANSAAVQKCETALAQKDRGDYRGTQETMRPLWQAVGEWPVTKGLDPSVAAEVLYCVGTLTSWIGSKDQIEGAQETAKNILSEAINYFESVGDVTRIAVARTEIACCYFLEGELNEARTMLHEALKKLTTAGPTRARALLKLTTVECSAARFREALNILNRNASLFQRITNHTIKGGYHSERAIIHRNLATAENRQEFFQRAVNEYKEADNQFRLARHSIFRADVSNNVGFLLFKLARYKKAHKYLDQARRLTASFKDKARTAQIDETRAQVFLAERKLTEAEAVARKAASAFAKSGHHCMRAEALITQGIALARLHRYERAQVIFQQAIKAAHQVNALNIAGLAALTLIEEIEELPPTTLQAAYQQARDWLSTSQSPEIKLRLGDAAGKFAASVHGELTSDEATEVLLTKPGRLAGKDIEVRRPTH